MTLPMCGMIPRFVTGGPALAESRRRVNQRLIAGGYEGMVTAHELMSLRFLMPMGVGLMLCALLFVAFQRMPGSMGASLIERQFFIYLLLLVLFAFYPDSWLKRAVRNRHKSIERSLPFVLDLLTLSVESGLDFMSGIQRIIEFRKIDAIGEELIRVTREIQVGRTRKEALKNLSDRVGHPDIRLVVNALVQADELGTGIGTALRIQAEQIRMKRFQRAEKLGNEAPVRLLFPLVAFIFPAVFMVLLGPVLLQMWIRGGF